MTTQKSVAETTLIIRRSFLTSPKELFKMWTDGKTLKQWFSPTSKMTTPVAQVDLRVGGHYHLEMLSRDGRVHAISGVYKKIKVNKLLMFSWRWGKDARDIGETLVTLEFLPQNDVTELVLTHDQFPDSKSRDQHAKGHHGVLNRLEALISTADKKHSKNSPKPEA